MTDGAPPGPSGTVGVPTPKTRMTAAYGRITKSLSKTVPGNLGKARQSRERMNRLFRVPTRKGPRG